MVGKKKRAHPDIEEILARPWCYYCERDFDDLKVLLSHQKAKHFKCERCGRRLNTAGGLSVHMNQVHKETLTSVENALGNRAGLEVEIFGMEGIPEDVVQAHNQRIIAQFYQAEADRRVATGNMATGGSGGGASKKPKFESPSELKKRLAEHKARMAEQATVVESDEAHTPAQGEVNERSPAFSGSPGTFNAPLHTSRHSVYGEQQISSYPYNGESFNQSVPSFQALPDTQPSYSPPGQFHSLPQYPNAQYPPQPSYASSGFPGAVNHGPNSTQYGASTAAAGFANFPLQPPVGLPNRPQSITHTTGLPPRPTFVNGPGASFHYQQSHGPQAAQYAIQNPTNANNGWNVGGWNGGDHHGLSALPVFSHHPQGYSINGANNTEIGDEIDEVIRMAEAGIILPKKNFSAPNPLPQTTTPAMATLPAAAASKQPTDKSTTDPAANAPPAIATPTENPEKKSKKEKDKNAKLVYSDNEVSPEEKMAKMSRYTIESTTGKSKVILMEASLPAAAGAAEQ